MKSLPTRERGLKYGMILYRSDKYVVAPYTGAWIEIKLFLCLLSIS